MIRRALTAVRRAANLAACIPAYLAIGGWQAGPWRLAGLAAIVESLAARAEQLEHRLAVAEERAASGVDVDAFGPPQAELVRVIASAVDGAHLIELCDMRFADGSVAPYVHVIESHVRPVSERWFALDTLVHLAMNVGDPEVWQVGNRPHRQAAVPPVDCSDREAGADDATPARSEPALTSDEQSVLRDALRTLQARADGVGHGDCFDALYARALARLLRRGGVS